MSIFDIPAITKDMGSKRNKWSAVKLKQENEKLRRRLELAEAVCKSAKEGLSAGHFEIWEVDNRALEAWRKAKEGE